MMNSSIFSASSAEGLRSKALRPSFSWNSFSLKTTLNFPLYPSSIHEKNLSKAVFCQVANANRPETKGSRALAFANHGANDSQRYCHQRRNLFGRCGSRKAALPHHQLIGLSQVLCGNGRIQTPGDVHRLTALVLYIVRSPEVGIGCSRIADAIRLKFADKE